MIAIVSIFWILLGFFAVIGMLRGWAKEIIATAGIVLALFALKQFGDALFPPMTVQLSAAELQARKANEFTVRIGFFLLVVFFAYQTPAAMETWDRQRGGGRRLAWLNEGLQQRILGFIIGLFNGWLVIGAIWSYADRLGYPFGEYVVQPTDLYKVVTALGYTQTELQETTLSMVNSLPLAVLGQNDIVLPLMVVILFLFVIIVMI